MLKILEEKEIGLASQLIEDGLEMASEAMTNILQSPIAIKDINYSVLVLSDTIQFCTKVNTKVHVLKTELRGDLAGVCFLLMSEEEVKRIVSQVLPLSIVEDNSSDSKMMRVGFLTELDNMVAAAVITKFSDHLGVRLFGQVPTHFAMKSNKVNNYIQESIFEGGVILHFKAQFESSEIDIAPDFIWIMDEDFVARAKAVS